MASFCDFVVIDPNNKRFRCETCGSLYREPVQNTETGKCFCKLCAKEGDAADYRQDNALRREMKHLCVICRVCGSEGQFSEMEMQLCPSRKDAYTELEERLAAAEKMIHSLRESNEILKEMNSALKGQEKLQQLEELDLIYPMATTIYIERIAPVIKRQSSEKIQGQGFNNIADKLEKIMLGLSIDQTKVGKALDENSKMLTINAKRAEALFQWSALQGELDEPGFAKTPHDAPVDFQIFSNGAGPPPNGSGMQCRFTIQNIRQVIQYAREHPNLPIVTPPWPTQPCGYCVQAYIFLNGYGQSAGLHVSIFIKVLPGRYNDYLKWPLEATLTFCLLDLKGKNSHPWIKSCCSGPDCPAFKQRSPLKSSDMNIVSGIPDFIPIEKMIEDFIKDDTIMIEMSLRPMR